LRETTTYRGLPADVIVTMELGIAPGSPVPSLKELVERTGLRPVDVALALEELADRHAIEFVPGSGRLVTRRVPHRVWAGRHASLTGAVERSGSLRPGLEWRSLVRSLEECPAPPKVAAALEVPEGRSVIELMRERTLGSEVVVRGTSWLRRGLESDLDRDLADGLADDLFAHGSLADVVEVRSGRRLRRLHYQVELDHPLPAIAQQLGSAPDEPMWWVQSVNGLDGGQPLELSEAWLRADVFRLLVGPTPVDPYDR
jgi:GntR family transcriptional regulator